MTYRALLGVLGAGLVSVGCGPGLPDPAAQSQQPASLNIPPPRPPRVQLSAAEAALIIPELDKLERDPFLYYEDEHPVEVPKTPTTVAVRKAKPKGPQPLVLKQLHETVTGIITGPRNTFFFQGKLFEEGDTLPDSDWVVISIKPSGIRLRSKDGATDFLPFVTDSSPGGFIIKKTD